MSLFASLGKLVAVFELYEKFTSLRGPSAAITWARELMGVSKPRAQRPRRRGQAGQSQRPA
jgi:hypothetical protein